MGRAPAYIFVVRHGNRLDAADKQWHLHSPTPYDPPLTYSGWNQARSVGQKIGELLRERQLQDLASATDGSSRKRRRYKVVIHSSPFLRCVQTSIGISAGLASVWPGCPALEDGTFTTLTARTSSVHSINLPRTLSTVGAGAPLSASSSVQSLSSLPKSQTSTDSSQDAPFPRHPPRIQKTILRLDAFLGEWLTPNYFEAITPPPGSSLMLASAKAALLRREDYSKYLTLNTTPQQNPSSGQMWSQTPPLAAQADGNDGMPSMVWALSHHRAGSNASLISVGSSDRFDPVAAAGGYVAPVLTYAVSHNAEIPKGFVPHARDNCCKIDYQWDSMRGPLHWGDGGQLGEEWTQMHRRFRTGLQRLVDWYSTAENPTEMVTKERKSNGANGANGVDSNDTEGEDDEDVETEAVVVLVSHGAGCNAMVGAITHQPVLADIGVASLTQAVRKPEKDGDISGAELSRVTSASSSSSEPTGLIPLHQYYDLKLFGSLDHLRSSSAKSSRSPSITAINRGRHSNTFSNPLGSALFSHDGSFSRSSSAAANLASARRDSGASSRMSRIGLDTNGYGSGGITVGSGVTSFTRPSPATGSPSFGLWSPLRNESDVIEDDDDDFLPNFNSFDLVTSSAGSSKPAAQDPPPRANGNGAVNGSERRSSTINRAPRSPLREKDEIPPLPKLTTASLGTGAGGLWGSPQSTVNDGEVGRDMTSAKRRWTMDEQW